MLRRSRKPTFDELYAEYSDRIYRYCFRLCRGNEAEAEDLAQEVFILAYRGLERFEGRSSVLTWLYRITLNHWMRKRKKALDTVPAEETLDRAGISSNPIAGEETRLWLESGLASLTELQREAILLVKSEGLTHREAAEVLGVSLGTIQSRVHDGIKRLRELLSDGAGVTVPLFMVDQHLQSWHNVSAPASLTARVYESIGRSLPPSGPGTDPYAPPVPAPGFPIGGDTLLRAGAIAGLAAIVTAGGVAWVKYGPKPSPEYRALNPVLQTLSRARSAHATGIIEYHRKSNDARSASQKLAVDFWFKLPGRYRQQMRPMEGYTTANLHDLVVDGGRGRLQGHRPNKEMSSIAVNAETVYQRLAPFAFFTADGALPSAIRDGQAQVTILNGEYQNREAKIFIVDYGAKTFTCRWTLYVDPNDNQVMQVDYVERKANDPSGAPVVTGVLKDFEYNIGVQDDKFAAPDPETSPAQKSQGEAQMAASN